MYDDVRAALFSAFTRQATPGVREIAVAVVLAVVAVGITPLWRRTRHLVTVAHEGGHALVALLTGRRLAGIRLHADTSGLTVSVGRATGPGMVLTLLVGYLTPPALGLAAAAAVSAGWVAATLWAALLVLVLLLVQIRNVFGGLLLLVAGTVVVAVSSFASPTVQVVAACALAWVLLLGGVRASVELAGSRSRRRSGASDADQLARLTHVPAVLWVGLFVLGGAALALAGGRLLVPLG